MWRLCSAHQHSAATSGDTPIGHDSNSSSGTAAQTQLMSACTCIQHQQFHQTDQYAAIRPGQEGSSVMGCLEAAGLHHSSNKLVCCAAWHCTKSLVSWQAQGSCNTQAHSPPPNCCWVVSVLCSSIRGRRLNYETAESHKLRVYRVSCAAGHVLGGLTKAALPILGASNRLTGQKQTSLIAVMSSCPVF